MHRIVLGGLIATGLAMAGPATATTPEHEDITALIESIRTATARFQDVNVALAEGYIPEPSGECVRADAHGMPTELGSMGIHYLRPDLLGITVTEPRVEGTGIHTDFHSPGILLYEPQDDGSLVLVGVENLVFEQAWAAAGHTQPPSLAGRSWDAMADDPATAADEAHGFAPHYDQHVWLRENAHGNLEPFNPAVNCKQRHM
ncbi:hypothetical protein [Halomonas sp. YLGW01]|uniref:hypothetical protein n=1 Tax=Halomonas sp. YLGW01 TaxID=2773308 RepID=UPI00192D851D|nr:hypothetical protein [Halomonas sp. YLGW01]